MSVNGFDDSKNRKEVYTKEEIDNKVIDRSNIVVLRGTMTLTANTDEYALENRCTYTDKTLSYPEGFSLNNCVVLSIGTNYRDDNYGYGWCNYLSTLSFAKGILPSEIVLKPSEILLSVGNLMASESTINYKIVLMKYEVLDSEYTLGDVNQDGQITVEDSDLALSFSTGEIALTEQQIKAADIDKDGVVLAQDALQIRKYAEGTIDSLE